MEARHGDFDETHRWIEWIDGFVAKLDPLTTPPTLPAASEESADALRPFMLEDGAPRTPN